MASWLAHDLFWSFFVTGGVRHKIYILLKNILWKIYCMKNCPWKKMRRKAWLATQQWKFLILIENYTTTQWVKYETVLHAKTGVKYTKKILVSQLQSMKKNWAIYDHYANGSGFGVDSNDSIVTAAPGALNSYLQCNPKAAQYATTPLPFYRELCSLFSSK
jgi:Myb/SANT-like DNA-binding domain